VFDHDLHEQDLRNWHIMQYRSVKPKIFCRDAKFRVSTCRNQYQKSLTERNWHIMSQKTIAQALPKVSCGNRNNINQNCSTSTARRVNPPTISINKTWSKIPLLKISKLPPTCTSHLSFLWNIKKFKLGGDVSDTLFL
jgi:hypothetical protein